jgi:hypothetical protein
MLNIEYNLLNRGDICVFLKLKGSKMFNFSWIYFHDSDIIFSRIHEPLYYSEYDRQKALHLSVLKFQVLKMIIIGKINT